MSNDAEMTDAQGGAEANGGEEFVHEKQRLKIVWRACDQDIERDDAD